MYLSKKVIFSGLVGSFLYITCFSQAHHWNHLFNLHWSNYTNITKSSNNKPHYIIFCVLLLLTPFTCQIFSWPLFSQSPPQAMLFLQCDQARFHSQSNWKNVWLMVETLNCTSLAGCQKIKFSFLKNCSKSFSRVKFLFHKYRLIRGEGSSAYSL